MRLTSRRLFHALFYYAQTISNNFTWNCFLFVFVAAFLNTYNWNASFQDEKLSSLHLFFCFPHSKGGPVVVVVVVVYRNEWSNEIEKEIEICFTFIGYKSAKMDIRMHIAAVDNVCTFITRTEQQKKPTPNNGKCINEQRMGLQQKKKSKTMHSSANVDENSLNRAEEAIHSKKRREQTMDKTNKRHFFQVSE